MELQSYDTTNRMTATVAASVRLTAENSSAEVRELLLDIQGPFHFEVGLSVGVLAPGQSEFGQTEHLRLYSVADIPVPIEGGVRIHIAVRRCFYVDEYNGETYPGVASNYLCDLRPGDTLTLTGPYGLPFEVPQRPDANLVLIATSTGIAPFRALVRHLYENETHWKGKLWLFYGGRTGLDLAYLNDERNDFARYYQQETFEAFRALSSRPDWTDTVDWGDVIHNRGEELWHMLESPQTYVYVAGLKSVATALEVEFTALAGGAKEWARRKAELVAGRRWVELLY